MNLVSSQRPCNSRYRRGRGGEGLGPRQKEENTSLSMKGMDYPQVPRRTPFCPRSISSIFGLLVSSAVSGPLISTGLGPYRRFPLLCLSVC